MANPNLMRHGALYHSKPVDPDIRQAGTEQTAPTAAFQIGTGTVYLVTQTMGIESVGPVTEPSKYPPAKPGALDCWPLKAAGQVADATCKV